MAPATSDPGVQSMTGFARADGRGHGARWTWEIRSVNGKGLDVRFRGPPGMERIEPDARSRVAARFSRGSLQLSLTVVRDAETANVRVNREALAELVRIARDLSGPDAPAPSIDRLFSVRGIVELADSDEAASDEAIAEILATLDQGLDALAATRQQEGAIVAKLLTERLDRIGALTERARSNPARSPEAIRARLADQVAVLIDASSRLDPDRLHQEAALLATRADIAEELDRLTAHVEAARGLLAEGGAIGRRLDFLAQEFNREANTLCSKSNDTSLTAIGLDLKATVDQFREQVQNLE